jgi:hypothetical protein
MAKRILAWLPWVLAEVTLVVLEALLWPEGGLWLLILWTCVLLVYRGVVGLLDNRAFRLIGDGAFGLLCVLAAFEGGWYLLPAVAAFAGMDARNVSLRLPPLPPGRGGDELIAAAAATFAGWLGLAIAISGPLYSTATAVVSLDGTVFTTTSTGSLIQSGMTPQAAAVLATIAVLFGLVGLLATAHVRKGRHDAWLALLAVTIPLVSLAILSSLTVGLWIMPGTALAVVAVWLGRPVPATLDRA